MVNGFTELSIEHILLLVVIVFLLYTIISSCSCANRVADGFSIGYQNTSVTSASCMTAMKEYCPQNCSSTLKNCQVCTGQHSQIRQAGCKSNDVTNYCDNSINFIPDTMSITINASQLVNKVWIDYKNTSYFKYESGICKNKNALNLNIPLSYVICNYNGVDASGVLVDGNTFGIYWDRNQYSLKNTIWFTIDLTISNKQFYFADTEMCLGVDIYCEQSTLTYQNTVNNSNTFIEYVTKLLLYPNEESLLDYKNIKIKINP